MEPYAGFEPHVGEIRAVRTFRIGPDGMLYPLFSDTVWSAGDNTARCRIDVALGGGGSVRSGESSDTGQTHEAPEPDCTCGYYAYASEKAAGEYPNARHVLAVVACWGRLIAGTRGVRAQHGRVEAIWMSRTVPGELAAAVADRYPEAGVYSDKQLMFAAHPPTVLDCYDADSPEQRARQLGIRAGVLAALILGALPHAWITAHHNVWLLWTIELMICLLSAVSSRRRPGVAAKRRALQSGVLVLWLLSPFGGAAGTLLLRIPMIQLALLVLAQRRVLSREANRFPAKISPPDP
jgi:hypothetical protein